MTGTVRPVASASVPLRSPPALVPSVTAPDEPETVTPPPPARLLTPPAALGLLPGVLREQLIAEGRAREGELTLDDLTGGFWIGNALRGLMRAVLV